ncbi:IS481 family transposase [Synoicihabitans lomoniglobus]|uniref:IS481 family transposase n=1 Tax=Synoicihabitans lomoniglobus TaxID=2909285 RepID=A0AAE9ZWE8_9BACT|nr:integrase core domain-containing protein [Opitutaceae bacterium LMO-M01]WED64334.1 IS481 family transposase [Opitutaceae bacterium LMO-M01]WED64379.1 IS481 family transposase [Opitutaceae bacterium LMO-M01]WED66453.1 IS481 family transposase [Opitutaceae bacterium LMO-M01]
MPWKEVSPMDQKMQFISMAATGRFTVSQLCEDFDISRKTGHKWLRRYAAEGSAGLGDRSRRPRGCAHQTTTELVELVLQERKAKPSWGPKKLQDLLHCKHGIMQPPARSTIASLLKSHGLIKKRRRKPGLYHPRPSELTDPTHPNHVWTFDYKGWFLTQDRIRCDPLTVCDRFSRYVVCCQARYDQQFRGTHLACRNIMRYHGVPEIIRVDNGSPFASNGWGRLSRLSVWWISQGIQVEFTRPGHPQDNGSHERMHRDLKAETLQPSARNQRAQQRLFDRWRFTYNHERPHEGINMQKPAEIYHSSQRRLNENDNAVRYPADYLRRRVTEAGFINYRKRSYHVGEAFAGVTVGIHRTDAGTSELHFANIHLANLTLNAGDPFRPAAYMVPPHQVPLAKHNP